MRHLPVRLLVIPVLLSSLVAAGCSSSRDERAAYDERQTIRNNGQSQANQAANQGTSDLNQATAPGK